MMTARMPSSGLWDRSAGSADASAAMRSGFVTASVAVAGAFDMVRSIGSLTASFERSRPPTIPIATASSASSRRARSSPARAGQLS